MILTPFLKEVFFGDIQDKEDGEVSGMTYAIESGTGDSTEDLYDRAIEVINLIKDNNKKGNILVVGHGSFTSIIFGVLEGKKKKDFINYRNNWNFKNGEVKVKQFSDFEL